jgi:hypothetical protein
MATGLGLLAPQAQAAASCSGTGCDGKDPYLTGCATGAIVAEQTSMIDGILLRLMYSPYCRTVWGSIEDLPVGSSAHADVISTDNAGYHCDAGPASGYAGLTSCSTPMIYHDSPSHASAAVQYPNGVLRTAQTRTF